MMNNPSTQPEVYTTAPTMAQRERVQWRIAYLSVLFHDETLGVVALATAPLSLTSESILQQTADAITLGMMATYPGLDTLLSLRPHPYGRHLCLIDSLTAFERRSPVEFSALYFQFGFLEKVEVAYERVAAHTPLQCETFGRELARIERAVRTTVESDETSTW